MLDVTGGKLITNAIVVIQGDRITMVNPASPPAGARTIDLGDVTLLPGLIDLHTHLPSEISATSFIEPVRLTESDFAFNAVANALKTIQAGFTTVRDFGGDVTVALGAGGGARHGHRPARGPVALPPRHHRRPLRRRPGSRPAYSSGDPRKAWPTALASRRGGALPDQARSPGHQDLRDCGSAVARRPGRRAAVQL